MIDPAAWYETEPVTDAVVKIIEPHLDPWIQANLWLYRGPEVDVLVDTGSGIVPLAPLVESLRDLSRPLVVVATHVHVDHAGALHEFPVRLGHAAEAHAFAAMADVDTVADALRRLPYAATAPAGLPEPADYRMPPAPLTRVLEEGDTIDIGGGRAFEVLHLPGHSEGSIALLDRSNGLFFAGDVIYDGELLDALPRSDKAAYRTSLARVLELPVAVAYCGHGPVLTPDEMRRLARVYLDTPPEG
jgi:glyoxylase-like metal-dependent hydrolase (beta-lactamase superfamily II)